MAINIDLGLEAIEKKSAESRKDFSNWLSKNGASIKMVENELGNSGSELMKLLSCMDIELETAADYSRRGEVDEAGFILAQAKLTKDAIYGKLMEVYKGTDRDRSISPQGTLTLWRDYLMKKYDGGVKQCEFLLTSRI